MTQTTVINDRLAITGMHCSACYQIIEYRLKKISGISEFRINIATHQAEVSWEPQKTSLSQIIDAISTLGYGALPMGSKGERTNRDLKMSIWRLFVAGFAMMQVMMYALPAYLEPVPQINGDLTPDIDRLLKLASLALSIPVMLFSAQPFFQSALRDIRNRTVGMDIPVAIGILVTFTASVWATLKGGPVYYDSLIMFVFLLLAARTIQAKVHEKSTTALRKLTTLLPITADRLVNYPQSMQTENISANLLSAGNHVLVQPGSSIPVDGEVISGHSECDESLMTGESHPVSKTAGSPLIGGSINLNRPLIMRATQVGDNTRVSSLVRMMESAAAERPPLIQLVDRYASYFLGSILLLAIAAAVVWWYLAPARAIWIAVTIMVITCPCALSLATPGVMSAAIGQLARNGVLIARGRAIESLSQATHFVFDKTGTLTQGQLKLIDTLHVRISNSQNSNTPALIAASMAGASNHPVARALIQALSPQIPQKDIILFDDYNEIPGQGIEAKHQERTYRLGSLPFAQELGGTPFTIPDQYGDMTVSALADSNGLIALFILEDTVRNDAKKLTQYLQANGKEIYILSGDREQVVQRVANELNIKNAIGNLSPESKFAKVKELQEKGARVAMIGDGMNDGPVLSLANVSIAMGQGAPISQARSDMVLISNDLMDLHYAVNIASRSLTMIRQNIGWAILYNLIAIPAAALGTLEPWHAAIGMSLSSIVVVANSLRIYAIRNEHRLALIYNNPGQCPT